MITLNSARTRLRQANQIHSACEHNARTRSQLPQNISLESLWIPLPFVTLTSGYIASRNLNSSGYSDPAIIEQSLFDDKSNTRRNICFYESARSSNIKTNSLSRTILTLTLPIIIQSENEYPEEQSLATLSCHGETLSLKTQMDSNTRSSHHRHSLVRLALYWKSLRWHSTNHP